MIIEVDGGIHEQQKEYDLLRDMLLKSMEYKILRFDNDKVLNDIEGVIKEILKYILIIRKKIKF